MRLESYTRRSGRRFDPAVQPPRSFVERTPAVEIRPEMAPALSPCGGRRKRRMTGMGLRLGLCLLIAVSLGCRSDQDGKTAIGQDEAGDVAPPSITHSPGGSAQDPAEPAPLAPQPSPQVGATVEAEQHAYEVHLQSGFDGKQVTVQVNGKPRYHGNPETNYTNGLADSFRGTVTAPTVELLVEVPERGIQTTLNLNLNAGPLIGINVGKAGIDYQQANRFDYD